MATSAYLSLGSNVGDRLETLTAAIFVLHESDGIAVGDVSGIYETAPWGGVEQDPYLNCCVRVVTSLGPTELLDELQATETAFGRDRDHEERWGPRPLDIDLLLYGEQEIATDRLTVPHPRMGERAFVLVPLMEIMPGGALPNGTRLTRLLAGLLPVEGVELVLRLEEVPGGRAGRPEGPPSAGAFLAEDWERPARGGAAGERARDPGEGRP